MLLLSIAQSHLTLLLREGRVFDWCFHARLLKEMRECPMCLGAWTALGVSLTAGLRSPCQILVVAGVGHVLYLVREKYLPCDKCTIPPAVPFKFTNVG
jgi:hypothetical protein